MAQTTNPSRALDTSYQNTGARNLVVYAIVRVGRGATGTDQIAGTATAVMDTGSTPTTEIARIESRQGATAAQNDDWQEQVMTLMFIVPPASYYRVNASGSGEIVLLEWKEQEL